MKLIKKIKKLNKDVEDLTLTSELFIGRDRAYRNYYIYCRKKINDIINNSYEIRKEIKRMYRQKELENKIDILKERSK